MDRPDFQPQAVPGATLESRGAVSVPAMARAPGYVYAPEVVLAVRVALATARPLLVTGEPGVGKSTLAENAAAVCGWPLVRETVTSRTQARDLMWRFDTVRRLSDASRKAGVKDDAAYLRPAALWHAFAPEDAAAVEGRPAGPPPQRTVVLIDEIDKAEPDVPNDLLEALDRGRFDVDDLSPARRVEGSREKVLMVITSNGERDLPDAFLRRCVTLRLAEPDAAWLQAVARRQLGARGQALHAPLARRVIALRQRLKDEPGRKPGTAEYLDALEACIRLGIGPRAREWKLVERATLWKR